MDQDELILGCLEIASTNEISSLFFNLVMGKFLGQGQKAMQSTLVFKNPA